MATVSTIIYPDMLAMTIQGLAEHVCGKEKIDFGDITVFELIDYLETELDQDQAITITTEYDD